MLLVGENGTKEDPDAVAKDVLESVIDKVLGKVLSFFCIEIDIKSHRGNMNETYDKTFEPICFSEIEINFK